MSSCTVCVWWALPNHHSKWPCQSIWSFKGNRWAGFIYCLASSAYLFSKSTDTLVKSSKQWEKDIYDVNIHLEPGNRRCVMFSNFKSAATSCVTSLRAWPRFVDCSAAHRVGPRITTASCVNQKRWFSDAKLVEFLGVKLQSIPCKSLNGLLGGIHYPSSRCTQKRLNFCLSMDVRKHL